LRCESQTMGSPDAAPALAPARGAEWDAGPVECIGDAAPGAGRIEDGAPEG
jgi:hypothetical protein